MNLPKCCGNVLTSQVLLGRRGSNDTTLLLTVRFRGGSRERRRRRTKALATSARTLQTRPVRASPVMLRLKLLGWRLKCKAIGREIRGGWSLACMGRALGCRTEDAVYIHLPPVARWNSVWYWYCEWLNIVAAILIWLPCTAQLAVWWWNKRWENAARLLNGN